MAFDMGFDFRATAGYVTDPAYGVPVLSEAYPHTYTNSNGDSINAGWTSAPGGGSDLDSTNDPRIAGQQYSPNDSTAKVFQVDLSSGSNPGAGDYVVDVAFGHATGGGQTQDFKILDTSTVLIDGTNGGSGIAVIEDHYVDATLADVAATTTWTGTTATKTFATTTAKLQMCEHSIGGTFSTVAHFRLTVSTATGTRLTSMLMLLGVGV